MPIDGSSILAYYPSEFTNGFGPTTSDFFMIIPGDLLHSCFEAITLMYIQGSFQTMSEKTMRGRYYPPEVFATALRDFDTTLKFQNVEHSHSLSVDQKFKNGDTGSKENLNDHSVILASGDTHHATNNNIVTGDKVFKISGKPFKSGLKVNTVMEFTINPHTTKPAFKFEEDKSVVDAHQCEKVQS